jgi:protein-L-isoaspartate O-methyltransferase
MNPDPARARERAYHDALYGGFAQQHFAKPAVKALRAHMAGRILSLTAGNPHARVLSLGCGIGDTEMLIAPRSANWWASTFLRRHPAGARGRRAR